MKYAWIMRHRDSYPIVLLCEALDVSKASCPLQKSQSEEKRRDKNCRRLFKQPAPASAANPTQTQYVEGSGTTGIEVWPSCRCHDRKPLPL